MAETTGFIPLEHEELPPQEMLDRARAFSAELSRRRSVRHFSDREVSEELIREIVQAAGTAPSGANLQPWSFVAVSDPALKKKIREGAEEEERQFYGGRAPEDWLEALEPLGTDASKPFLETAPWLIVVFALPHGEPDQGSAKHYYVSESVGIACGMLLSAVHRAGLCSLTHTPSPMKFLRDILGRPEHERAYLLIPVGYPADGTRVPDISRKSLDEILTIRS